MRHRDFLLRILEREWQEWDTRRILAFGSDEYAVCLERQTWIDEIRDDLLAEADEEAEAARPVK